MIENLKQLGKHTVYPRNLKLVTKVEVPPQIWMARDIGLDRPTAIQANYSSPITCPNQIFHKKEIYVSKCHISIVICVRPDKIIGVFPVTFLPSKTGPTLEILLNLSKKSFIPTLEPKLR